MDAQMRVFFFTSQIGGNNIFVLAAALAHGGVTKNTFRRAGSMFSRHVGALPVSISRDIPALLVLPI